MFTQDSITSWWWQIPCFISAYLIKACILMFFYDASKICISQICGSKSPPPVDSSLTQLYSVLSTCTAEWIGLSAWPDLYDPPVNSCRRVIGGCVLLQCLLAGFKRRVDLAFVHWGKWGETHSCDISIAPATSQIWSESHLPRLGMRGRLLWSNSVKFVHPLQKNRFRNRLRLVPNKTAFLSLHTKKE